VLTTWPKGRGFKPYRGDGFLRAIKFRSTPSFGWEIKAEAPCRKILRHVKSWRISGTDMKNSHLFVHSSYSLPDVSAGRIARELWWTSKEFFPAVILIITMAFHAHVSPGGCTIGPLVTAVLRRNSHSSTWWVSHSLTHSLINQSINQSKHLWNIGKFLSDCTTQCPKRQPYWFYKS
jgi:hypothetical protein